MSEEQDEKERGFKIEDRRRFTSEGEARDEEVAPGQSSHGAETPTGAANDPRAGAAAGAAEDLPEDLTFSSFVIGLASQAFVYLGAVPDPQSGAVRKDLLQAKAMIDILSMLSEKTAGNLDEHESRMMEEMLYELRMHYVRERRSAPLQGGKS
jgi:hypothetical protein